MELLDLYDENGKPINKTIERDKKIEEGYIMLSIIFIKNKEQKYLIQKTSEEKGSKYTSTGGHIQSGENGIQTIIRETKEELGLKIKEDEIETIGLVKHPERPCLFNLYILNKDININNLILQKEEVEEVKWMSEEEIIKLIDENKFLASHGYLLKNYIVKRNRNTKNFLRKL